MDTEADPWQGLQDDLHHQWAEYLEWVDDYERTEMGITAKNAGSDFKQVPAGSHIARCIKLTDLGTQENDWKGEIKFQRQVLVTWEIPGETIDIEGVIKPMTIGFFYTLSLNEKANLRKHLVQWRGKEFSPEELEGFELKNILGKPCLLSVIDDKGKSKVSSVSAVPKGLEIPPQFNQDEEFSLEEFNQEHFDALGEGLKKMIMKSPEYQKIGGESKPSIENIEEDIPF